MAAPGKRTIFIAAATAVAIGAACGSSNPDLFPRGSRADGSASGSSSGSGSGGSDGDDGGAGMFMGMGVSDAGFSLDAFMGCAATTEQAKELPLDLYLMLDTSSSMFDLVGPKQSKWTTVVSALTAFVDDPASAGIGVGLQYFPLNEAGVPASCTASSQCGAASPCFLRACAVAGTTVYPCDTSANCPGRAACQPIGFCQYDHNVICSPSGPPCGPDGNGFDLGPCQSITSSTCILGDSCNPPDYATPAVPIALLPGAASAVTASLAARVPAGNTPTAAALQGAINQAKAYAAANPAHSVVAVLATDGIPDECDPNDIPSIAKLAAQGLAGSPGIKTFTIGVFAPDSIASGTSALNQIASSGGTTKAFVIDTTSANVEQQFVAALSSIRGASLPCQYEIPLGDGGVPDYDRVNVEYTSGAGAATGLPYVPTAAQCGTGGGWYYDKDPAQGAAPSAILVCPTTCTTVQGDPKGRIDVVIGCQTVPR